MSEKGSYYARVLGTFWRHPRTLGLSMAARGLWVSLLSWSADQRSDGAIPAAALTMVCGGKPDARSVADLLSSGLLVRVETAYTLRDWSQHNITRQEHDAAKEATRKRVAAHRSKAQAAPDVTRYTERTNGVTSEQEQEQEQDALRERERRARAPEPAPDLPPSASAAFDRRCEEVRKALTAAVRDIRKGPAPPGLSLGTAPTREVSDIARWLATADGVDLGAMARRWAGARQRDGKWVPLSWLAQDPTEWASEPPSASAVRLTPEQDQASIEDLMRAGGAM